MSQSARRISTVIALMSSVLVLYGCAVHVPAVPKETLRPIQATTQVEILRDFPHVPRVKGPSPVTYSLIPGRYVSIVEDAGGVYFEGEPLCVVMERDGKPFLRYNGGIWLPRGSVGVGAKIFTHAGTVAAATPAPASEQERAQARTDALNTQTVNSIVNMPRAISPAAGGVAGAAVVVIDALVRSSLDKTEIMFPTDPIESSTGIEERVRVAK